MSWQVTGFEPARATPSPAPPLFTGVALLFTEEPGIEPGLGTPNKSNGLAVTVSATPAARSIA
jgi:hypothetical protein